MKRLYRYIMLINHILLAERIFQESNAKSANRDRTAATDDSCDLPVAVTEVSRGKILLYTSESKFK